MACMLAVAIAVCALLPCIWYQGGHMTFSRDAEVKQCVLSTLTDAGLVSP